ncbi:MAG TPA: hypothetical protein V6D00_09790 [Pantanalinema sp.]
MPQRPNPFPKLPQGGVLEGQRSPAHVGELPDLAGIEDLPPTERPMVEQTSEAERVLDAVAEGDPASLAAEAVGREPFSPPTSTPWGRESPAELGCGSVTFAEEAGPAIGQQPHREIPDTPDHGASRAK